MDMKKLFHVLVVGGAVIGTGGGCAKPKASEAAPAQTPPSATATPPSATATPPKPDSDTNGTPQAQPQEKGGGANGW